MFFIAIASLVTLKPAGFRRRRPIRSRFSTCLSNLTLGLVLASVGLTQSHAAEGEPAPSNEAATPGPTTEGATQAGEGQTKPADEAFAPADVTRALDALPPAPEMPSVPAVSYNREAAVAAVASATKTTQPAPPTASRSIATAGKPESLASLAKRLKLPLPLPNARIVVTKAGRRLDLYSGPALVKSYKVALGGNPVGAKQRQGDSRTPEGQFYICTRNARNSAFHIFLGLSYPALPDATRGFYDKAIDGHQFNAIRGRLASRGAPLWGTRLGGWVGIHGGTDAPYAQRRIKNTGSPDWTAGCIALTNKEIDELHAATCLGTPVLVKP